jgi:hypothetical protein
MEGERIMKIRDTDILFWSFILAITSIAVIIFSPYFIMLIEVFIEFMSSGIQAQAIVTVIVLFLSVVIAVFLNRIIQKLKEFRRKIISGRSKKETVICWISSLGKKERLEPQNEIKKILNHMAEPLSIKNIAFVAFPTAEQGMDDWSEKHESEVLHKQKTYKFGREAIKVVVIRSSIIGKSDRSSLVESSEVKQK